eukprot:gnl/MRDRNA2_/MRDRNA2_140272_c0_seq1.p1 gnl/MRDRNA2_/MRDRNA2_140272_c0~~gnl/MRDRNA2_/MRDRNA2_140272_c0_seq1.p1  ORF type:complete len:352 (-),score=46.74 gnl/MRDRNA2_/MRDRNA2_140272_c0_seq1:20-1075(-)
MGNLFGRKPSANSENIRYAQARSAPSKKVFVLVNPSAGNKKGLAVFNGVVTPMLQAAQVQMDVAFTSSADSVSEITKSLDLKSVAAVLVVSGDGTLHEFINAYARAHGNVDVFKTSPICPVGVGTCNGLAVSLGLKSAIDSMERVLDVLHGASVGRDFDLYTVTREATPQKPLLDFHLTCWGLIADIDLQMERFPRWLPSIVRTLWTTLVVPVKHFFIFRTRSAYIRIFPADGSEPKDLSGEFVTIGVQNVAWTDASSQMIPHAKPDDGMVHVFLLPKGPSRISALKIFLAMEDGSHVGMDGVTIISAKKVELAPSTGEMDVCGTGESGLPGPAGGKIIIDAWPSAVRMTY